MKIITDALFSYQDTNYKLFTSKLNPNLNLDNIIGVKNPLIAKIAAELDKNDCKYEFISELPHKYIEENLLHGMLLGKMSKDIYITFRYVEQFLPYIDNWAVCDTSACKMKIFKIYPDIVYEKIMQWLDSKEVYTVRFALVCALDYFLNENFHIGLNDRISRVKSDNYYVNMAVAWYYSTALVKQYDNTIPLLENDVLNKWIHNKSIQKALDSFRITDNKKEYIRSLKR